MHRVGFALLGIGAAACAPKVGGAERGDVVPVNRWIRWYDEIRYVDVYVFPDRTEHVAVVETYHREEDDSRPAAQFRVDIGREGGTLLPETSTRYATVDAEGYGRRDERLLRSPSDIVLPADPVPGTTWSSEVVVEGTSLKQTCRVDLGSPYCQGGLVSTCRASKGPVESLEREHFCPRVGWRGAEIAIYQGGAPLVQLRSTQAEADGKGWPDPPDEQRPYPMPQDVAHPDAPAGERACGVYFTATRQSEACRACGERACCDRAPRGRADLVTEAAFACQLGCLLEPGKHDADPLPGKVELYNGMCLAECAQTLGRGGVMAAAPLSECVAALCGSECSDGG